MSSKDVSPLLRHFGSHLAVRYALRKWFLSMEPVPDRPMALLWLCICQNFESGSLLNKKQACSAMQLEDMKTARKYINRSVELGLVELRRSTFDKRMEQLIPTERLLSLVEAEVNQFVRIFERDARMLAEFKAEIESPKQKPSKKK